MRRRSIALVGALWLGACAAPARTTETSAPRASPPPPPPEYPTSSPTVTEEGDNAGKAGSVAPVPPSTSTGATPTLMDDIPHAKVAFDQSEATFAAAGTDCAQMCKALSSMQRAADHLCDLTKDGADLDKQKCSDARARVTSAKDRVAKVCGGCGP